MGWGKKTDYRRVERVSYAGMSFASKLEQALYENLLWRQRAGEIRQIQTQPSVYLTDARILFKPDFRIVLENFEEEFHEAKGFRTAVFQIKRRLWRYFGPAPLYIYEGSHKNFKISEIIIPKTKKEVLEDGTDENTE